MPGGDRLGPALRSRVRSVGLITATLLIAVLAAPGIARLEIDNSPRALFVRDDRMLGALDEVEELFGGGPTVRIAWIGEGLWTADGLAWLDRVSGEARAVAGVASVHGPLELDDWWRPSESPAEVGRRLREDPMALAGGWVSPDGALASLLVELESGLSRGASTSALDALETLAAAAPRGLEAVLVGLPVIERAMDRSYERLIRGIFPGIVAVCLLLLAAACRNVVDALLPLAAVALVEGTLLGAMGWAGVSLNLISSILIPIVFVLGLAIAVHLQMRFRVHRARGLDPAVAAGRALRDRAWAVLWAGFTTAVAFSSFAFSGLTPVRELGLWTAGGVVLIVLGTFAFQAPAMALLGGAAGEERRGFDRLGRRLGEGAARLATTRRRTVIVALVLFGGVAAAGLPRLELGTSLLGYFPAAHPVPAGFEAVAAHGVGAAAAELVLRLEGVAEPRASFRDPERLERLAELSGTLRAQAPILGAIGAGDLYRAAGRRAIVGGPTSERMRWLILGLLQTEPEARRRFELLATADGRTTRLRLLLPVAGYEVVLPALERAASLARESFPEARVEWTGHYPLVLAAQRDLLSTVASSLGLTALAVAVVLAFLLRSPARWAAAMAANLWPLLLTAGGMGWAGLPLDSTTVMIAAVALGIAVDDTLHTFGELRARGGEVAVAIGAVAPAQLLTTLILGLGFAGCALADFLPIARFGLLTAAALGAALVGDWLLLPALLGRLAPAPGRRVGTAG